MKKNNKNYIYYSYTNTDKVNNFIYSKMKYIYPNTKKEYIKKI